MSGEWVTVVPPPHFCQRPDIPDRCWSGSVWRCDCGQHWRVMHLENGGSMWEKIPTPETPRFGEET